MAVPQPAQRLTGTQPSRHARGRSLCAGERDVPVSQVFTPAMWAELKALMTAQGWGGVEETEATGQLPNTPCTPNPEPLDPNPNPRHHPRPQPQPGDVAAVLRRAPDHHRLHEGPEPRREAAHIDARPRHQHGALSPPRTPVPSPNPNHYFPRFGEAGLREWPKPSPDQPRGRPWRGQPAHRDQLLRGRHDIQRALVVARLEHT